MLVRALLASTVAALMVAGSADAAVNLVTDGTFTNQSGVTGAFKTYKKNQSFGSWKVIGNDGDTVDLVTGSYWAPPAPGERTVDLNGFVAGGISETTGLVKAGTYVLTFDLSGNPFGQRNAARTLEVSIGDVVNSPLSYSLTASNTKHNMNYQLETIKFYYDGSPAGKVLSFLSTSNTDRYGPVIGDIQINAVPEPATWAMMLIGFGGLGAALRMNRRRAFATA